MQNKQNKQRRKYTERRWDEKISIIVKKIFLNPRNKLYVQCPHKENYKYLLKEILQNWINEKVYHVP